MTLTLHSESEIKREVSGKQKDDETVAPRCDTDTYSERESAIVFDIDEQGKTSNDGNAITSSHEYDDSPAGFRELIDQEDIGCLDHQIVDFVPQLGNKSDVFRCTLPVRDRVPGRPEVEALGINAARRKQRRMAVCGSDCSTVSSTGMSTSRTTMGKQTNTCGCFRLLRGVVRSSAAMTSQVRHSERVSVNWETTYRQQLMTSPIRNTSETNCCRHSAVKQPSSNCIVSPSAVQTFSFANTKIGNAVSGTDCGLVVRVNSCRGGQHQCGTVDVGRQSLSGEGVVGPQVVRGRRIKDDDCRRQERCGVTSSKLGSDLSGNFTLVPRRCTEVRRAIGGRTSRHRRLQREAASSFSSTATSGRHPASPDSEKVAKTATDRQLTDWASTQVQLWPKSTRCPQLAPKGVGLPAVAVWRRLVSGLGSVADDGRKLCRRPQWGLTGVSRSYGARAQPSLTACRRYNLLTNSG